MPSLTSCIDHLARNSRFASRGNPAFVRDNSYEPESSFTASATRP